MELKQTLRKKFVTATYWLRECGNCHHMQNSRAQKFTCKQCKEKQDVKTHVEEINPDIKDWEKEVPKDIRDRTLDDFYEGVNSSFALLSQGHIKHFRMNFRKKKGRQKSMEISKTNIHVTEDNNYQFFKTYKIFDHIDTRGLAIKPNTDVRLVCDGFRYFLHFEKIVPIINPNLAGPKIIGLDPGKRKFMTGFSSTETIEFHRDETLLQRLFDKIDKLKSLRAKKQIPNQKKNLWRKEKRIKNLVTDLHLRTANYLCKNYTDILIPVFETQQMITKLHAKVSRILEAMSHYTFRKRLIEIAAKHENCRIYVVNEAYTTSTCTRCGHVNKKRTTETITCVQCDLTIDRDIAGSRNVMLKHTIL